MVAADSRPTSAYTSLWAEVAGERLHVAHFRPVGPSRGPVLLIHGSVENARIFYSASGDKGLAAYLVGQGYEVFAADLRGRGASRPRLSRRSRYGQREAICEDLPALAEVVARATDGAPQIWMTHSWGGVLAMSHLVRFPASAARVRALVQFATKRIIAVRNREVFWKISFGWNIVAPFLTRVVGYLPARTLGMGSDDETRGSHADCQRWVAGAPWINPTDGFDYGAATPGARLPRTLWLAGVADACLGHPHDVAAFRAECGAPGDLWLLGKEHGCLHDYGHIDLLTHADAPRDHLPRIVAWLA